MSNQYFENNENLKSNIQTIKYYFKKNTLLFDTDNGVFSKDAIDYGSRVLIETFIESSKCGKVLDAVPRGRPYEIRKLSKNQRRPNRPYGGMYCTNCTKQLFKEEARSL